MAGDEFIGDAYIEVGAEEKRGSVKRTLADIRRQLEAGDTEVEARVIADMSKARDSLAEFTKRNREAEIEIDADVSDAQKTIKKFIAKQGWADFTVDVEADVRKAQAALDRFVDKKRKAGIDVDADVRKAQKAIEGVADDTRMKMEVDADTAKAKAATERLRRDEHGKPIEMEAKLEDRGIANQLKQLRTVVERSEAKIPTTLDGERFRESLHKYVAEVEKNAANIPVELGDRAKMRADLRRIVDSIENVTATLNVDADTGKAHHDLDEISKGRKVTLDTDADTGVARAKLSWLTRPRFAEIIPRVSKAAGLQVATQLAALSGLRVLGDYGKSLKNLLTDLDRTALRMMKVSTATMALGGALYGALQTVGQLGAGLGQLSGLLLAAPGLMVGFAVGTTALVLALKDAKTQLAELGPAFTGLQKHTSDAFWNTARQPILDMAHAVLPSLDAGLTKTGAALGGFAAEMARVMQATLTPETMANLFAPLVESINIAKAALDPLINAFVTLGQVGGQYLPRLAGWFVTLSNRFNEWVQLNTANGNMFRWIDQGISALKLFGSILGSTGSIIGSVFKALNDAGANSSLAVLADGFKRVAHAAKGPVFQGALTTIFEGLGAAMKGLGPIIQAIGGIFAAAAPQIKQLGQAVGDVLGEFGKALQAPEVKKGLSDMVGGVAKGIQGLKPAMKPLADLIGTLGPIVGKLATQIGRVLGKALEVVIPPLNRMLKAIEPLIPVLGDALVQAIEDLAPLLPQLVPFVEKLVDAWIDMLPEIVALIPPLTELAMAILPKLMDVITVVLPVMELFMKGIFGIVKWAVKLAEGLWDLPSAFDLFTGNLKSSNPLIKKLADGLHNFVDRLVQGYRNIVKGVQDFGKKVINGWNLVKEKTADIWQAIVDAVKKAWEWIKGLFSGDGGGQIAQSVTGVWQNIKDAAGQVWDQIKDVVKAAWDGIKWLFETTTFPGQIMAHWDTIKQGTQIAWGWIVGIVQTAWQNLATVSTTVGQAVVTAVQTVWTWIQTGATTAWTWVTTIVSNAWQSIITTATTIGTAVVAAVQAVWTWVQTAATVAWQTVVTVVQTAWQSIITTATTIGAAVVTAVQAVWTWVQTTTTIVWQAIVSFVQGVWNQLVIIVTNVGSAIAAAASAVWNGIKNTAVAVWNAIKAAITNAWNGIRNTSTSIANAIKTTVTNVWNAIRNTTSSVWNAIKSVVTNAINGAKSAVSNGANAARSALSNAWNSAKSITSSVWGSIVSTITNAINRAVSVVRGIRSHVMSAMSGAGTWLVSAGRQIIDGLVSGIQSAVGRVRSALSNVTNMIPSWKGPPNTDKRLLQPAGQMIMAGLVSGIVDGTPAVKDTLVGLTGSIVSTVNDGLGIASPSKVFQDIGKYVNDGFIKGIQGTQKNVQDVMKKLADMVVKGFEKRAKDIEAANKKIAAANDKLKLLALGGNTSQSRKVINLQRQLEKQQYKSVPKKATKAQKASIAQFNERVKKRRAELKQDIAAAKKQAKTANTLSAKKKAIQKAAIIRDLNSAKAAKKAAESGLTGNAQKVVLSQLNKAQSQLEEVAKTRESVTAQLKAANESLADILKQRADYESKIADSLVNAGNIANQGSEDSIITTLEKAVEKAKEFGDMIRTLRNRGLNSASLDQIVQAGPDSRAGKALMEGSQATIDQVNRLQQQLVDASKITADVAGDSMYSAGIRAAQGLVDGLTSQQKFLDAVAKSLSDTLVNSIKKSLKIKSPSRRLADEVGQFIPTGIVKGIDSKRDVLKQSMADLVPSVQDQAPMAGVNGASNRMGAANITQNVYTEDPRLAAAESIRMLNRRMM